LLLEPMASTIKELVDKEGDGRLVMVDPNLRAALVPSGNRYRDRLEGVIARSTIVKASEADLAWLFPGLGYEQAADEILRRHDLRLVVATLGARGAFGASTEARVHVSAHRVDVADTIGAGDAFGAGLLAWLHDRNQLDRDLQLTAGELEDALRFACLVAAIACTRAGAEPPFRAEIERQVPGSS
jgi:fructokinase